MIFLRIGHASLIRVAALLSVVLGALYMPSVFHIPSVLSGLSQEISSEERAVKLWAVCSLYGGIIMFAGTFVSRLSGSPLFRRLLWGLTLLSAVLLIVAQLPPLFWWMYVGSAVLSWHSGAGMLSHMLVLLIGFLGGLSTIQPAGRHSAE
ncbi:hypothetical protein ACFPPD_11415 [Cohnella suwonensis]|uniref:Uncharacterized protein n=1 Tax=Cohnella suwonensis TaxID=696072 RepID=A0ABW0LVI8_9BACL